jgi:hypothetical protein
MSDPQKKPSEWQRVPNTEIFLMRSNGTYYERPKIEGVHTFRSLGSKNFKVAAAELKNRESIRATGEDPQPKPSPGTTVGACIKLYQSDGYKDRNLAERSAEE